MSYKTNENAKCGKCGELLDAATAFEGDHKPRENDITICIKCGSISQFNKDFSLRPVTQEFLDKLEKDDEKTFLMLSRASGHIKASKDGQSRTAQ